MNFISNGDYIFSFGPALHWIEHLFVWSFQTGAPNLDGIIRIPARLLNMVVFQIFGNLAVSYFYLIIGFIILFFAFYWFARSFLNIKNRLTCIIGSLLFTFNPIFLGNLAKLGLVIAVATLPMMFVVLKRGFEERKLRYLLLYVVLLNVSLVHPYTFTVNLIISGIYLAVLAWRHRDWLQKVWLKIGVVVGVGLLLNMYFILPILSVGSIDKSVLSQDLADTPVDYTALVGIANTGDMLTAMSMAKDVFLDFNFYNNAYKPLFFIGAFGLLALLIGAYVLAQKNLPRSQNKKVLWCFAAILVLLLLSTATLFNVDALIKTLIDLPGGWMFRSPLKWQLYIPVFLVASLLICVKYLPAGRIKNASHGIMIACLLLANGYLVVDIYNRLLVPRQVQNFAALNDKNIENSNMLFVTTDACMFYAQERPDIFTEFNQVMGSKNVQMKRVSDYQLKAINLDSYDYIMGCVGSADDVVSKNPNIQKIQSIDQDGMELYENKIKRPVAYAVSDLFALPNSGNIQAEGQLVNQQFGKVLDYTDISEGKSAHGLYELFGKLGAEGIRDDELFDKATPNNAGQQQLLVLNKEDLYYKKEGNRLTISPDKTDGFSVIPAGQGVLPVKANKGEELDFRYRNKQFDYKNLIPNPSFEAGLWQKDVSDCNNFDKQPVIAMSQDKSASSGSVSLRLEAKRHIACTGPVGKMKVKPGGRYLLSFDYQSSSPKRAGYFVGFNNKDETKTSQRLPSPDKSWQTVSEIVEVPQDADELELLVYSYPDYTTGQTSIANYDNFYLTEVPDIRSKFFLLSPSSDSQITQPGNVEVQTLSPTARVINVKNVKGPFYLAMKDTFHPKWKLALNNGKVNAGMNAWLPGVTGDSVDDSDHFVINGSMNAWYVDPSKICQAGAGCTKNADGTIDIEFLAEFTPQRWLYGGLIISGFTVIGVIGYFIYVRRRQKGGKNE